MEAVRYWILNSNSNAYRWITVTPAVVGATERVKRTHRLHLSLVTQRASLPLCGQYHIGEYHPWPLRQTKAVATEDACVECVRVLLAQDAAALGQANRMLFVQGTITEIQPAPMLPPPLIDAMNSMAVVVQQQQQLIRQQATAMQQVIEQVITIFLSMDATPPEALLSLASPLPALIPASPSPLLLNLELLLSYQAYGDWIDVHPTNAYIVAPNGKTASRTIVHHVTCKHVTDQAEASYNWRIGMLDPRLLAADLRRDPDYCGDCLGGQAPR